MRHTTTNRREHRQRHPNDARVIVAPSVKDEIISLDLDPRRIPEVLSTDELPPEHDARASDQRSALLLAHARVQRHLMIGIA